MSDGETVQPLRGKPTIPAGLFEIRGTRRVVGEKALKFGQRLRERQVFTGQDIHGQLLTLVDKI